MSSSRSISPPPLKKRRTSPPATDLQTPDHGLGFEEQVAPEEGIRIFSWNINGVAPFLQRPISSYIGGTGTPAGSLEKYNDTSNEHQEPPTSLRAFLTRHRYPQIVCLQEVKINANDEKTKAAVRRAANGSVDPHSASTKDSDSDSGTASRDEGPRYVVRFCLPRDKHNARGFGGKVYGVATLIRTDFFHDEICKVREVDWDLEGRVLVTETKSKMAVFNIYAVNGTDNQYRDPGSGAVVGTRHDRKLAFHRLLLSECLAMEKRGWELVLAGDFNIARSELDGYPTLRRSPHQHVLNRADFNSKFFTAPEGLQAVDSWRSRHGSERGYTYYPRGKKFGVGCDRVDLIIVSRSLVGTSDMMLRDAGILASEEERGPSDHVPLWIHLGKADTRGGKAFIGDSPSRQGCRTLPASMKLH